MRKQSSAPPPLVVLTDWKVYAMLALVAVAYFPAFLLDIDEGLLKLATIGLLACSIVLLVCRPLWRTGWFWSAMSAFGLLQIVFVSVVPWTAAAEWTGATVGELGMADTLLMLGAVRIIYRLLVGVPDQWETEGPIEERYGARDLDL